MATARERTIICPSARNRFLLQCAMRLCDAAVSAACSHSTSCFHLSTQVAVASSMRSVVAASTLEVAIPRWRSRHAPGLAARPIPGWIHRARESIVPPHPGHPHQGTGAEMCVVAEWHHAPAGPGLRPRTGGDSTIRNHGLDCRGLTSERLSTGSCRNSNCFPAVSR